MSPSFSPRLLFPLLLATSIPLGLCACDRVAPGASQTADRLQPRETRLLLLALEEAPTHGFRPGTFGELGLAQRLKNGDASAPGALRRAVLAYAVALHGRAIALKQFDPNWGLRPAAYDPAPAFDQALAQDRLEAWLQALPPPSQRYQSLRAGYLAYARVLAAGGWRPVPEGPPLKLGSTDPRVGALRGRLSVEDSTTAAAGPSASGQTQQASSDRFDDTLVLAVKRAQLRYGLKPTGVADATLLAELNLPVEARLDQIRGSLERLRWLPRETPPTRIEVNTAAGLFDLYRDGQPAMHMLAAAGRPGDDSPMLTSAIETVVLNPEWRIPDSIADKEILPKAAQDGGYLARHHYEYNDGDGVKLVQQPGRGNALGQVKFLFPNPYSVYLHDTPARAAFVQSRRSVSHGCVRLERAVDLAKLLLSGEQGWSAERVDEVLQNDDTTTVTLKQKLAVTLIYLTAFAGPDGSVSFRPDVYGWDAEVLRLLDAASSRNA